MLHAILITHGSSDSRLTKAEKLTKTKLVPSPDTLILEPDPSITIKQVRQLEQFLSKKSYGTGQKIALIIKAHLLTLPAQHAMLKTLEEPPANSKIILLAPNPNQLLDTIISRCQIITLTTTDSLNQDQLQTQQDLFTTIITSNLSKRITFASSYGKSKLEALDFCQLQLTFLKPNIQTHAKVIAAIIVTIQQLNSNVNPKLALESLLFKYPTKLHPGV